MNRLAAKVSFAAFALALASIAACTTNSGEVTGAPSTAPALQANTGPMPARFVSAYRRLTESQYRHAIADTFGADIAINARFEPEKREDGLQAVGSSHLSITTTGLEQYVAVARSVADQVVDDKRREKLVGCAKDAKVGDEACATAFLAKTGQQLYRRPLSDVELAGFTGVWKDANAKSGNFSKALNLSLVSLLISPEFLFRVERAEADPAAKGAYRLDGYGKASRLSYALWDAGPDAELIEAARSGAIHDPAALKTQVNRLLASPRVEAGVRAFFTDMLQFEAFDTLSKDAATYPNFSQAVADGAREETLRFMVDHLVTQKGDYRDVFTSRDAWINRSLASIYDVPYPSTEDWAKVSFPASSERSGLLTQVTFLALFSHPAASSPTVRGVKLNEIFTCLETPQPPPDVDFSKVQALENGTVRERLISHMTNPGCSACHRLSDPPGLALEKFDGLGQHRALENGKPIDVSAETAGKSFVGSTGLGKYMHDNPEAPACLVRRVQSYGAGRAYDDALAKRAPALGQSFASAGYRWDALMRDVYSDPQFYSVSAPQGAGAAN